MKKLILALIISCAALFAESALKIEKIIDNGYGAIASGGGVVVGQSGVATTWINGSRKVITAKAVVVGLEGSMAKIKFEVITDIAQESLPVYITLPKVGDEIVFGLFENRAAVVAKNQGDYLKILARLDKQTVHPDLIALKLMVNRKGEPTAEYFTKFCVDYSVANIYFAIGDTVYKTDCGSMKVINSEPFDPSNDKSFESPFFHRLGKIDTGYLGFATESVKNYEEYYKRLLGVR